jgi:nucleoside-diphosphate-sugar epimerase
VTCVLVTGASGFIGRHCLNALAATPGLTLHATSRKPVPQGQDGITWHQADLLDAGDIHRLIARVQPTHLLHAAWEATPVSYSTSPENIRWLAAGRILLDAFGQNGGKRFLGIGTSAEYAPSDEPCHELRTLLAPSSIYGEAKVAMAEAAGTAATHYGFAAAWGRLFLPFGPGDPPQRLLPSVLASFRHKRVLKLSDGLQVRDFIYAPDAGQLLARLLLSGAEGPFNIGSGIGRTLRSVLEALAGLNAGEDLLAFGELARRPGEPPALVAEMTRYEAHIGPLSLTPFDAALRSLEAPPSLQDVGAR